MNQDDDLGRRRSPLWVRAVDRLAKHTFCERELLLARMLRSPARRVLFSETHPAARSALERSFSRTHHSIHFAAFEPSVLAAHDVFVPTTIAAVRRLQDLAPGVGDRSIPISSRAAVDVCDDKLLFHRALDAAGLAGVAPSWTRAPTAPCVVKKRVDHNGRHTHVALDPRRAAELAATLPMDEYLCEELIPGRREYASHILVVDGEIRCSLTIEYDMGDSALVKGPVQPVRGRRIRCRFIESFGTLLRAVGFEGLCCVDFKIRDGRPVVLEVNPRLGGSLCPYLFSFLRHL